MPQVIADLTVVVSQGTGHRTPDIEIEKHYHSHYDTITKPTSEISQLTKTSTGPDWSRKYNSSIVQYWLGSALY